MANNKLEKAIYGPSMVEVVLGAVLGLLAGVAAAGIYLVFKPVQLVKEMPKEPSRSAVYFMPGAESNTKGRTWSAKQKQFLAGQSVQVVEDELNAWAATLSAAPAAAPAAKPAAAKPGAAKPAPAAPAAAAAPAPGAGFIIPGKPNFRVAGDKLQVGLKCTLNWFGLAAEVTVQATGGFRKSGDHVVFVPQTVYLGSCPLHLVPSAAGPFVSTILTNEKIADEVRVAWSKVRDVTIEGGMLKLAVQ